MNKLGSQAKASYYAADPQRFVHSKCILDLFKKNFLKKFDRKILRELAFESDEIFSVSERILGIKIGAFKNVGTWGTRCLKSNLKAALFNEEESSGYRIILHNKPRGQDAYRKRN